MKGLACAVSLLCCLVMPAFANGSDEAIHAALRRVGLTQPAEDCAGRLLKSILLKMQKTMELGVGTFDVAALEERSQRAYKDASKTLSIFILALVSASDKREPEVLEFCNGKRKHLSDSVLGILEPSRKQTAKPTRSADEMLAEFCTEVPRSTLCR